MGNSRMLDLAGRTAPGANAWAAPIMARRPADFASIVVDEKGDDFRAESALLRTDNQNFGLGSDIFLMSVSKTPGAPSTGNTRKKWRSSIRRPTSRPSFRARHRDQPSRPLLPSRPARRRGRWTGTTGTGTGGEGRGAGTGTGGGRGAGTGTGTGTGTGGGMTGEAGGTGARGGTLAPGTMKITSPT